MIFLGKFFSLFSAVLLQLITKHCLFYMKLIDVLNRDKIYLYMGVTPSYSFQ